MVKRVFTPEQDREVARLYSEGLSSIKLAHRYGVDKSSILNALKRQSVRRRRSKEEPTIQDKIAGMKDFGNQLLTQSEAEQAYKIYTVMGYSLNKISQAYGFGKNGRGLSDAFKRYGLDRRGGKILTEEQETEAVRLYSGGLSTSQVAKKMGVSFYPTAKAIRQSGDSRKHTTTYKYSVNENMFSQIDNEVSAYILGFIYADGTITNGKVLRIMISETDRDHLAKINLLLGSSYPIYKAIRKGGYKTSSEAIALHINNPKLIRDLTDCGVIVGRGQFYKTQEKIHESVRCHFIRGYLDGDGCIRGSYNPSVTFVGQSDILQWIRKIFHQELDTNPWLSILEGKGVYSINYVGINQATLICQWLYKDATIWLQRKKAKFEGWPKPKNKRRPKH